MVSVKFLKVIIRNTRAMVDCFLFKSEAAFIKSCSLLVGVAASVKMGTLPSSVC